MSARSVREALIEANEYSEHELPTRQTIGNVLNRIGYRLKTDASVHDSQMFAQVLDIDNESDDIWADSAYYSVNMEATLALLDYISHIHERGYRNHPLNDEQKASNREKSKTRVRVEHVFGHWVTSMGGKRVRYIGIERVRANQGLKALSYNLSRYVCLQKQVSCA
ncbi:MAG: transposase [Cyanobacteria bacterium P01_F01_bin.150]